MSHLPPQNPNDYTRIKGTWAPTGGASSTENPTGAPPAHDSASYRNTPLPVPYGCYDPPMGRAPVPGFGWNDPVLTTVQRKRSATRKVWLSSGIIGLITMIIQTIVTTTVLVADSLPGQEFLGLALLALLMMIAAPFIVGLGWIATFILALIACIRAHSRTSRVQPDGWGEAKMPTSVLLVASIVAGFPALITYVIWFSPVLFGSSYEVTDNYFLQSLLFACGLVQVLIAVGFVFLLRMSKALDPSVRALQAPGTQSA